MDFKLNIYWGEILDIFVVLLKLIKREVAAQRNQMVNEGLSWWNHYQLILHK